MHLREGDFSTSLFTGRFNHNCSRKLLTSAIVQLNFAARLSLINVRLRYLYRPNSDFFIIYNQSTGAGSQRPSYRPAIQADARFHILPSFSVSVKYDQVVPNLPRRH